MKAQLCLDGSVEVVFSKSEKKRLAQAFEVLEKAAWLDRRNSDSLFGAAAEVCRKAAADEVKEESEQKDEPETSEATRPDRTD